MVLLFSSIFFLTTINLFVFLSGVHIKSNNCNAQWNIEQFKKTFEKNANFYFPNNVAMQQGRQDPYRALLKPYGFGGWSDPRDIQLCISFFNQSA